VREEGALLENHADPAALGRVEDAGAGDGPPLELDRAEIRRLESGDHP
jgi:hypothetical protein